MKQLRTEFIRKYLAPSCPSCVDLDGGVDPRVVLGADADVEVENNTC